MPARAIVFRIHAFAKFGRNLIADDESLQHLSSRRSLYLSLGQHGGQHAHARVAVQQIARIVEIKRVAHRPVGESGHRRGGAGVHADDGRLGRAAHLLREIGHDASHGLSRTSECYAHGVDHRLFRALDNQRGKIRPLRLDDEFRHPFGNAHAAPPHWGALSSLNSPESSPLHDTTLRDVFRIPCNAYRRR